jgi:hypothetical protein
MAKPEKKVEKVFTALEIDESIDLHIKAWRIQPIAWFFIMLFIATGALGLYGTGWLSKAEFSSNHVTVRYEKYFRYGAQMKLEVSDMNSFGQTVLMFNGDYLSNFSVESVVPEPDRINISGGAIHYFFKGSSGSRKIAFFLVPQEVGRISGALKVNDRVFHLSHLIYP